MPNQSRRTFLVGAGAGVVAGVAASTSASPAAAVDHDLTGVGASSGGPIVAYVHDVGTGEIAVMSGDREVVFADRALAARLARKLG